MQAAVVTDDLFCNNYTTKIATIVANPELENVKKYILITLAADYCRFT